jgi:hypothetical protein
VQVMAANPMTSMANGTFCGRFVILHLQIIALISCAFTCFPDSRVADRQASNLPHMIAAFHEL